MEGYDTILMGSLLAYPSFINQFANTATADGERQISAPWQAALVGLAISLPASQANLNPRLTAPTLEKSSVYG